MPQESPKENTVLELASEINIKVKETVGVVDAFLGCQPKDTVPSDAGTSSNTISHIMNVQNETLDALAYLHETLSNSVLGRMR